MRSMDWVLIVLAWVLTGGCLICVRAVRMSLWAERKATKRAERLEVVVGRQRKTITGLATRVVEFGFDLDDLERWERE